MTLEELFLLLGAALYDGADPKAKVIVYDSDDGEEPVQAIILKEAGLLFDSYLPPKRETHVSTAKVLWSQPESI